MKSTKEISQGQYGQRGDDSEPTGTWLLFRTFPLTLHHIKTAHLQPVD